MSTFAPPFKYGPGFWPQMNAFRFRATVHLCQYNITTIIFADIILLLLLLRYKYNIYRTEHDFLKCHESCAIVVRHYYHYYYYYYYYYHYCHYYYYCGRLRCCRYRYGVFVFWKRSQRRRRQRFDASAGACMRRRRRHTTFVVTGKQWTVAVRLRSTRSARGGGDGPVRVHYNRRRVVGFNNILYVYIRAAVRAYTTIKECARERERARERDSWPREEEEGEKKKKGYNNRRPEKKKIVEIMVLSVPRAGDPTRDWRQYRDSGCAHTRAECSHPYT